jgi:aspartate kinase
MSTQSPLSSKSPSLSPSPPTPPNLHQNTINPDAKWLVQKYGGTCVGKFGVKIAKDIVSYAVLKTLFCVITFEIGDKPSTETTLIAIKLPLYALHVQDPRKHWERRTYYSVQRLKH